ncbi:hypothetical protein BJX76DRAFT_324598, partial [Aspergillus varians]
MLDSHLRTYPLLCSLIYPSVLHLSSTIRLYSFLLINLESTSIFATRQSHEAKFQIFQPSIHQNGRNTQIPIHPPTPHSPNQNPHRPRNNHQHGRAYANPNPSPLRRSN